jgi:hypothetical protein
VSLNPLHEWVARIVFDLPQARSVAIAGGNAMLAHDLVVRPTQDLDLFTPVASEVDPLVAALAEALRGQGAARDLVDVAALTDRYPLQQLCALAKEKDSGFDPSVLADAMNAAAEHPNDAFAELGLSEEATSRLRSEAQEWRAALLAANTENPTLPSPTAIRQPPPPGPTTTNPSPVARA